MPPRRDPKKPTRHYRCPGCRQVHEGPAGEPVAKGQHVLRFDWPQRICPECLEKLKGDGLQAIEDAREGK